MFNKIKLKNFFSFADSDITLNAGVNILVGINGSGKSNVMKAFRILKEGVSGVGLKKLLLDQWGGFDNIFFFGTETNHINLSFEINHQVAAQYGFGFTHSLVYEVGIHKLPASSNYYVSEKLSQLKAGKYTPFIYMDFSNGKGVIHEKVDGARNNKLIQYDSFDGQELVIGKIFDSDRYFAIDTIRKMLSDITVYEYFDTTPVSRIRKPVLPTSEQKLLPDGSNLAQVLNTLKIQDKKTDRAIRNLLNQINSGFLDYNFNFVGGSIELMLEEQGLNRAVHISHISDGTLRFICLLAVLLNPQRGQLVCLDEPESGLHPDMIMHITEAVNEAAGQSQLIIATHSEQFLNRFELEEIKVVEKNNQNSSEVQTYTADDFAGWYDNYNSLVGQRWRNGDFGGNRY